MIEYFIWQKNHFTSLHWLTFLVVKKKFLIKLVYLSAIFGFKNKDFLNKKKSKIFKKQKRKNQQKLFRLKDAFINNNNQNMFFGLTSNQISFFSLKKKQTRQYCNDRWKFVKFFVSGWIRWIRLMLDSDCFPPNVDYVFCFFAVFHDKIVQFEENMLKQFSFGFFFWSTKTQKQKQI